jgi:heme oxygenase (biliverdin-IX-beta and delta-forming)
MTRGMTLLDRLKHETQFAHERIERSMDLERRIGSLASYRELLARFYGFHSVWEPAAESIIADPSLFRGRRKAQHLKKDLRALGMCDTEIVSLPRCRPLMPMPTAAAVLGAMYVVEGSTLGGAIIARQIHRRFGLTADTGCAYFRSYGAEVGPMWKAFGVALVGLSPPEAEDEVVSSANRTFGFMEEWLCGSLAVA